MWFFPYAWWVSHKYCYCITKHLKTQWLGTIVYSHLHVCGPAGFQLLWVVSSWESLHCIFLGPTDYPASQLAYSSYGNDKDTRQQAEPCELSYGPSMKPGTLSLVLTPQWPKLVIYPTSKSGDRECILCPWGGHGKGFMNGRVKTGQKCKLLHIAMYTPVFPHHFDIQGSGNFSEVT